MIAHATLGLALLVSTPTAVPAERNDSPTAQVSNDHPTRALRLSVEGAPPGLGEQLERALLEHEIKASPNERDGSLVVTIRPWSSAGVEGFGYDLDLSREEERVGEVFSQVCVGCSVEDLALEVAGHIATMAEALPPYHEEPPEPQEETHVPLPTPTIAPPTSPRRSSLGRPLLAAGIPTVTVGSILVGFGVGLLAKGKVVRVAPMNDQYLDVTDYRPPGTALLVSGGVAIVVGAVLTAVGARYRRTERTGHRRGHGSRLTCGPRNHALGLLEGASTRPEIC